MKFKFLLIFLSIVTSIASATNTVYVAQSSAGANDGSSCANAKAVSYFNTGGNWSGSPTGIQIGPGTTVHLCGTITTSLTVNGSGASGNPVEVLWETGARLTKTFGQFIDINSSGYLLFDGGIACGPGTSCDTVEAAHLTTYAAGQSGIIEAMANGSGLANQDSNTQAFYNCNGCHDIEIRNLIFRNLYIHSSLSDDTNSADTGIFIFQSAFGNTGALGTISIHDSTVHDTGNAISIERGSSTIYNLYKIDFYRNNWAVEYSGDGTRTLNFYNNHCHDTMNWDTSDDKFHHNCVHAYMNTSTDSIATNIYNNLSDGQFSPNCTTDTMLFTEVANLSNFNVYNNIAIQFPGDTAPAWQYGAVTGVFANNIAIGSATTPSNNAGIQIGGSNIRFENNATEGYGQYIVVQAGSTFTAFNNNFYGAIGISGNDPWQYGPTGVTSFSTWKTTCSCDAAGGNPTSLNVNSFGFPQTSSLLIGSGVNLTSLGITALNLDFAGVGRPSSGAWDVGAYVFSSVTPSNAVKVQGSIWKGITWQ